MATFPVKWFSSDMQGCPDLSSRFETGWTNSAPYDNFVQGQVCNLLKGFLIDGFGDTVPTGIEYDSGTDRVTVTFPTAHSFLKHSVIEVSGCDQTAYNGEHRITDVSSTTLKYKPESAPAATPATTTGGFNVRVPACDGWTLIDDDPANHRLVLGRTAADATPFYIVVRNDVNYAYTDWGTSVANQGLPYSKFEIVTSDWVDYDTQNVVETFYLPATASAFGLTQDTSPTSTSYIGRQKPFYFYADSHCFYWMANVGYYSERCPFFMGDILSARPGDRGHFLGCGVDADGANFDTTNWTGGAALIYRSNTFQPAKDGAPRLMTDYANFVGSTSATTKTPWSYQTKPGEMVDYPNPANQGLYLSQEKTLVLEDVSNGPQSPSLTNNTTSIRGFMPGYIATPQCPRNLEGYFLEGVPNFGDAIIHVTESYGNSRSESSGVVYGDYMHFQRLDQWRDAPQ